MSIESWEIESLNFGQHCIVISLQSQWKGKGQEKGKQMRNFGRNRKIKKLRMKGEAYLGMKKEEDGKWTQDRERPKRQLLPRCNCVKFKCSEVTEEQRTTISNNFWQDMTWEEKKVYVRTLVLCSEVKRRRSDPGKCLTSCTDWYFSGYATWLPFHCSWDMWDKVVSQMNRTKKAASSQ